MFIYNIQYTIITKLECMYEKPNKLKMHTKGVSTLKTKQNKTIIPFLATVIFCRVKVQNDNNYDLQWMSMNKQMWISI